MKRSLKRLLRWLPGPLYRGLRRLSWHLGRGGMPSSIQPGPFLSRVYARVNAIQGWLKPEDAAQFSLLLNAQSGLGLRGDILEIGCYHGRSSALLALHLQPDERLVVCDAFDLPVAEPYAPTPTPLTLRSNLQGVVPGLRGEALEIHRCLSHELRLPESARFRFVHVDGAHDEAACAHDLRLAARHLLPGGIIAVDDYEHPHYPGVAAAARGFLAANPDFQVLGDVNRVGALGRKLYLCRGQPNRAPVVGMISPVVAEQSAR